MTDAILDCMDHLRDRYGLDEYEALCLAELLYELGILERA